MPYLPPDHPHFRALGELQQNQQTQPPLYSEEIQGWEVAQRERRGLQITAQEDIEFNFSEISGWKGYRKIGEIERIQREKAPEDKVLREPRQSTLTSEVSKHGCRRSRNSSSERQGKSKSSLSRRIPTTSPDLRAILLRVLRKTTIGREIPGG